ncbi:MAG: EamA family transporter [Candidatus Micrarchaeaceae archaeon]
MVRKEQKLAFIAIMVIASLFGSFGQLVFKLGTNYESGISNIALYILIGVILYIAATGLYLYVLGRSHLSWAYSLTGISYIFTSILAFTVIGEPITAMRWLGITVLFIGIVLIGLS